MNPPKPEPLTCECGKPAYVKWIRPYLTKPGYWTRRARCSRCESLRKAHGLTLAERAAYLARGCAVEGCLRPAVHIDHDHSICPQVTHSCDKCRRGPLCYSHNTRTIAFLDDLRAGKLAAELAYIGWEVA